MCESFGICTSAHCKTIYFQEFRRAHLLSPGLCVWLQPIWLDDRKSAVYLTGHFFSPVLRTTTSVKALEDHHSRSCGTTFAALKCPYLVHTLAYAMQLLLRTWGDIVYHLNEDSVLPDLFPSAQTDINRYFSLSFPTHLKARFYWEAWCFVWYPEVCFRLEPCTGIHFKTEPYPCLRHSDPTWARCFYQM